MTKLESRPIAGCISVEISGVDFGTSLRDETIAQIRQALVQYKVIFIRQQSIDSAGQIAIAHPGIP